MSEGTGGSQDKSRGGRLDESYFSKRKDANGSFKNIFADLKRQALVIPRSPKAQPEIPENVTTKPVVSPQIVENQQPPSPQGYPTLEQAREWVKMDAEIRSGLSDLQRVGVEASLGRPLTAEQYYEKRKKEWEQQEEKNNLRLEEQRLADERRAQSAKDRTSLLGSKRSSERHTPVRGSNSVSVLTLSEEEIANFPPDVQVRIRAQQRKEQGEIDRRKAISARFIKKSTDK
jgi:hypothetical protein